MGAIRIFIQSGASLVLLAALCTAQAALSGRVQAGGGRNVGGVLVTAGRAGSDLSFSVVSQADGEYAFLASYLKPGAYQLHIRATGFDLAAPVTVEVAAGASAHADLKLVKTDDLPAQLSSAEWLENVPGTPRQKMDLYHCVACHQLTPILQSSYDAKGWESVLVRMRNYGGESVRASPVTLPFKIAIQPDKAMAAYLATIDQGPQSKWDYRKAALRTFPRPSGAAARVRITEYSLGAGRLPHDVVVAPDGNIWYNDFQQDLIGRLDPRTGATKEWPLPPLKPGFPAGLLSLKLDARGVFWIPRFRKAGITRFDPRTEKFTTWPVPKDYSNVRSDTSHVSPCGPDGLIWFPDTENRVMYRLHPDTGKIDVFQLFPGYHPAHTVDVYGHSATPNGHRSYGTACDAAGNVYYADIAGGNIGRIDAKTGEATLYKTPTLESGPRRMSMDAGGLLWFGENYGSKLGMFNIRTHAFKEWTPPVPWSGPYPAMRDRLGYVYTGGMSTDYLFRLDPKTGQWVSYLLPTEGGEIRWLAVDNSTTPPSVWVPEVHRGKIAHVQPLQ